MTKATRPAPPAPAAAGHPAAATAGVTSSTMRAGLRLVRLSLLSCGAYALIAVVLIMTGTLPSPGGWIYLGLVLAYSATFSVLVLGGFTRGLKDPFLGHLQVFAGLLLSLTLYVVAGPVADATLINLVLTLVYSIFVMTPRGVAKLVVFKLIALAIIMVSCQLIYPQRFRLDTQIVGFIYVLTCLPAIGMLAVYITQLHDRLARGRRELREALGIVEELAQHDELTGLLNRRRMGELLTNAADQRKRDDSPITIALIDLDHFKAINDQHGHAAGDALLQRFATELRAWAGENDTIARWGGEEFLILMVGKTVAQAKTSLEKMHAQAATLDVGELAPGRPVSFSAGLAVLEAHECPDAAIARADHAMYDAKSAGRARTAVHGERDGAVLQSDPTASSAPTETSTA
ncbi:MAG: GGDEF domain-containing protein [Burkholderiaceae bacterium]